MTAPAPTIAVTGLGLITPIGLGREATWSALLAGTSGIGAAAGFDTRRYASSLAAELGALPPVGRRVRDRSHQLALLAAREAVTDAAIPPCDPSRVAVIVGSSLGGVRGGQAWLRDKAQGRTGTRAARHLLELPLHACVEHLTAEFGFRGPRLVFSTACTASALALAYAMELLRAGRVDRVLAGGVDPMAEFSFAGFDGLGESAHGPCAPFGQEIGLTLGEGAAFLVLERTETATARGANVRARMLGYGLSADAYTLTSGDPTGQPQLRAARTALAMAGIGPADIGYVNAHGSGTSGNDTLETLILHRLLGERADQIPVSSVKGATGHTLGAAGAINAAVSVLALERAAVPPTANHKSARLGCDLDYVPGIGRPEAVRHALSLNFAVGGNNAALVFGAANGPEPTRSAPPIRRVVITGLGVISPIGCGVERFRVGLLEDRTGVDWLDGGVHLGARIHDFAPVQVAHADLRRADRIGRFTIAGADLAGRDAALRVSTTNQDRIGLICGTANGPIESCRTFFAPVASGNGERANPTIFPNTSFNAGIGLAAIHLGIKGPNALVSTNQSSGLAAICVAADLVRGGLADAVICGGADEMEPCLVEGYAATRRMAPYAVPGGVAVCAPFGRARSGLVLGEGCTMLAVEALDTALARDAHIYAEIVGWAANADVPLVLGWDPSGDGMAHCMTAALANAGMGVSEISMVAAAAMSHPLHDRAEARAINQVFGRAMPVAAMASRLGASAATAPAAAVAVALGMEDGFLPTGTRLADPDPACDITLLQGPAPTGRIDAALINAAGIGGSNSAIVMRQWA